MPGKLSANIQAIIWTATAIAFLAVADCLLAAVIVVPDQAETMQAAFDLSSIGDTILVSNNTYEETVRVPQGARTLAGNFIYSGNQIDIETTVLLPGDTVNADTACVLNMLPGCSLQIVGLTFAFGKGVRRPNGRYEGGAIYGVGSQLSLSDCRFRDCFADFGVCIWAGSGSEIHVRRTRFHENGRITGQSAPQGCIRTTDCILTVDSCRFDHNTVLGAPALLMQYGSATVENCVIDSNVNETASLATISGDSTLLTIRNTSFVRNRQSPDFLLAIFSQEQTAVVESCSFIENVGSSLVSLWGNADTVRACLFERNIAPESSTAGLVFGYGRYTVERCQFIANESPRWSVLTANGTVNVSECLFSGNVANQDSGALMLASNDSIVMHQCVIENNTPNAFSTDFWWFEGYVDARNCYWGTATGPYQETLNPSGQGDIILGTDVLFMPWLNESPFSVEERPVPVATDFQLYNPYPNPFNSSVTIAFVLTRDQIVTLDIFDVLGRKIETLLNERKSLGVHHVMWQADGQASGLYFARLSTSESKATMQTVKLLLMK